MKDHFLPFYCCFIINLFFFAFEGFSCRGLFGLDSDTSFSFRFDVRPGDSGAGVKHVCGLTLELVLARRRLVKGLNF